MPISTAGISTISDIADATVGAAQSAAAAQQAATPTNLEDISDLGPPSAGITSSSGTINSFLDQRLSTAAAQQDVHIERIIVLDDAKNVYTDAIRRIDRVLLDDINQVQDSIDAVNDAYQAKIDAGCSTDLFWRLVDIEAQSTTVSSPSSGSSSGPPRYTYTYECTSLSSVGYVSVGNPPPPSSSLFGIPVTPTNTATGIGTSVGVSTTTVEYVAGPNGLHESVPLDSLFGLQPVNNYALKMYDEPYTVDIGDTFVTSFIGTCGIGTNTVIAMTPNISSGISNIEAGQLLICDKPNVFNSDAYVITGVGTATANLSGINTQSPASTTSNVVVPKLTLDDTTIGAAFAPEDSGNYVTFTVLANPDSLGDLALSRDAAPYVPQRIKCPMTSSDRGKGVRIEFDNSGASSGSATWNQFLEGQTDPDANIRGNSEGEIRRALEENIVREPRLGGGKTFYKLGFRYAPVIFTGDGPNDYRFATQGETVRIVGARMGRTPAASEALFSIVSSFAGPQSAGVVELPECSSSINSSLSYAIETSDFLQNSLSDGEVQSRLEVANMLREDLNDINIRIWTERQLLGDAIERQGTYRDRQNILESATDLINGA
jgi:hypothetical protein